MDKRYLCRICLLLSVWLGINALWRSRGEPPRPAPSGRTVCVQGTVYRLEQKSYGWQVYLKNISFLSLPADSPDNSKQQIKRIIAYVKDAEHLKLGNKAAFRGECAYPQAARNPGGFDGEAYYRAQGVGMFLRDAALLNKTDSVYWLREALRRIRFAGVEALKKSAPDDYGVLCAMLFGWRDALEEETKNLYQDMGLIHLLCISGLHITMLGMALYRLLRRLWLTTAKASLVSACVMTAYVVMTGTSYSSVRALLMFLLQMLAAVSGRTYDTPTALAVSAAVILISGNGAAAQAGFLLSYAAVIGVLLGGVLPRKRQVLGAGLGVQLTTLPLAAYFYYQIPPYAILVNLPVLPLMPAVLGSALAAAVAGLFSGSAGALMAMPAHTILSAVEFWSAKARLLPFSTIVTGRPPAVFLAAYYLLFWTGSRILMQKAAKKKKIDLIKLTFGIILLVGVFCFPVPKETRMTFLDVGQGDGSCIETAAGAVFLIDGGSSSESGLAAYVLEPFLKSRGIDRVDGWFVSHYDADHVSGLLEVLESYERGLVGNNCAGITVDTLYLPKRCQSAEIGERIVSLAAKHKIAVRYVENGDTLRTDDMEIRVLAPDADRQYSTENAASMVLEISIGGFRALLTGDLEADGEEALLQENSFRGVDVLKVAHHGSKYATSEEFLSDVSPKAAVISCGEDNTYGHPSDTLLLRLQNAGCRTARTDRQGAVTVRIRQDQWQMEGYR